MKNKVFTSLGILIGLIILGGIFAGSSKPQIEGTKIVVPNPTAIATPTSTSTSIPSPTVNPTPTPTLTITPSPTIKPTPQPIATPVQDSGLSNDNYYINSQGNKVHSPAYSNTVPDGASAICRDGTYSFSQSRRGTCSHHGGVAQWL